MTNRACSEKSSHCVNDQQISWTLGPWCFWAQAFPQLTSSLPFPFLRRRSLFLLSHHDAPVTILCHGAQEPGNFSRYPRDSYLSLWQCILYHSKFQAFDWFCVTNSLLPSAKGPCLCLCLSGLPDKSQTQVPHSGRAVSDAVKVCSECLSRSWACWRLRVTAFSKKPSLQILF